MHSSALAAMHRDGVRIPSGAKLIVVVVGDEAGETGQSFAGAFRTFGYDVHAIAMLVSVAFTRGTTVRDCARTLDLPFSEVKVDQFDDPYQVPRVLKALLDAPRVAGQRTAGLVERVMKTPLLEPSD